VIPQIPTIFVKPYSISNTIQLLNSCQNIRFGHCGILPRFAPHPFINCLSSLDCRCHQSMGPCHLRIPGACAHHLATTMFLKLGISTQLVSKKNLGDLLGDPLPVSNTRGVWSEPRLVVAHKIERGNCVSHSRDTRTLSGTHRTGKRCLFDQVKQAPVRATSCNAMQAMESLNAFIKGLFTLALFLFYVPLIRLKLPSTITGKEQPRTLASRSPRNWEDRA
jgi:hypothetical protein